MTSVRILADDLPCSSCKVNPRSAKGCSYCSDCEKKRSKDYRRKIKVDIKHTEIKTNLLHSFLCNKLKSTGE